MLKDLLTKAPLLAVIGVLILFIIVAGAGMGLSWPILLAVASLAFALGEGYGLWVLWTENQQRDRHMRQIRFIADRLQSMMRVLPGGYCLFTPQGLMREEHGVAARLGAVKITHMDELIAAVKDGEDLLTAFKKLQVTGDGFEMRLRPAKDSLSPLRLVGRRFRIGVDGPHVDLLWFSDPAEAPVAAKVAAPTLTVPVEGAAKEMMQPKAHMDEAVSLSILDRLPFPVWLRDKDLRLIECNSAYASAVGKDAAAALAEQVELFIASAKAKGGLALASEALNAGHLRKDRQHAVISGERRLMEMVEIPLGGKDTHALLGYAIDVTAEEEKEADLGRHLAAHLEVLEHMGTAVSVYGPDMRLEFYNRAYVRLWGTPESFLDGKPTFGEIIEDLRARRKLPEQVDFQKYKQKRLALFTSLLEPSEEVYYLPDGTSLRIIAAPHPMGGLIFVHENVTDQLALETSYNTLMAVQRETIDNLAEGVAVFGPDGRVRLSNPSFAKMWELDEEFLKEGPHVSDMLDAARAKIDVDDAWAERRARMVSYALDRNPHMGRIDRTDKMIVQYATVPLPDGSVLDSFLDITDSVHVEQALRASNAALAAADRLKSDFVANVSYQLRTPLNTITGFAEILAEQYFGTLNERQMEYTTTIRAESEKLGRLINDVLDLATIEAGRMQLDRRPVGIAALLSEAKQMTADWARQQSLDILIDCPADIGTFEVDEGRMKQVLFNLLSNAIKYTPAGGTIAMAAWAQDRWVVISVLDTGVGIPEEDQDRVFGKFEKANGNLKQGGAGLGLSLVKSFIELHGGRVEILSDAKDGTRISCFVPRKAVTLDEPAHHFGGNA